MSAEVVVWLPLTWPNEQAGTCWKTSSHKNSYLCEATRSSVDLVARRWSSSTGAAISGDAAPRSGSERRAYPPLGTFVSSHSASCQLLSEQLGEAGRGDACNPVYPFCEVLRSATIHCRIEL